MEITAADVLAHNAELAERYGPSLYRLFTGAGDLLLAGTDAFSRQLGPHAALPDHSIAHH